MKDIQKTSAPSDDDDLSILENYELSSLRYKRTGSGRIVAIAMTILFFLVAPAYMKVVFKVMMWIKNTYFKDSMKFQFWANIIHLVYVQIIANTIFGTIYWLEHPFFEKYKIGN